MAQTYEINTISDFFKVPLEKRELCLKDLLRAVNYAEATMKFMESIGAKYDGNPLDKLVWKDDDSEEIIIELGNDIIFRADFNKEATDGTT